jgi:hypothetical protein
MRTETAAYKAERAKWVTQPNLFIRPYYIRKAGDLASYIFTRDFAMYDVITSLTWAEGVGTWEAQNGFWEGFGRLKFVCVKDVRGQSQELNPVAGRSSIGTLEVDLGDVGREILKQMSDPARPLILPLRGRPTIRMSSHVRTMPCAKTLYGTTWTQSGLASFTAGRINDADTETLIAFDADSAAAGSWIKLDLGGSGAKAFVSVAVYTVASGTHNAYWWVQYSDDDTTWTTISKGTGNDVGFGTGARVVDAINFPSTGAHRYWRLLKQNAATAGPDYYEVQFSEQPLGRNTILQVDDSTGYPATGHVTIDEEDIFYPAKTDVLGVLGDATHYSLTRAARDTIVNDHEINALVRNGEQLRRGTRVTLFLGYQPMHETDYGPGPGYTQMEVQSVISKDSNMTWTLRCADVQRFVKRKIFELATDSNPVNLGPANPITLLLQVWMSTGAGNNGPYDVLPRENGAAVPMALVDIAGWEALRSKDEIRDLRFRFSETEPQDSKDWGETQILRPLMILPDVNQSGQLIGRLVAQPLFAHGGLVTGKIGSA